MKHLLSTLSGPAPGFNNNGDLTVFPDQDTDIFFLNQYMLIVFLLYQMRVWEEIHILESSMLLATIALLRLFPKKTRVRFIKCTKPAQKHAYTTFHSKVVIYKIHT